MRSTLSGLALFGICLALPAVGYTQSLAQLAKQQGCTTAPAVVDGTDLYKCQTQGAMSYFSGPPGPSSSTPKRLGGGSARTPTPASFPRVDTATQRERDDVRKRVLTEELATETRMLSESETTLKQGSVPLADETPTS